MVYLVGVFMGITIPTYGGYYNSYTHKYPNCTPMASDWPAFMGAKISPGKGSPGGVPER